MWTSSGRRWILPWLLALSAWYFTLWCSRVSAYWEPALASLSLGSLQVAETEGSQTHSFEISSQHPDCPNPIATVSWSDRETTATIEIDSLLWSTPTDEVRFKLSTDCAEESVISIISASQTALPWGVATQANISSIADYGEHLIPLGGEPTLVHWYVPNAEARFSLELVEPSEPVWSVDPVSSLIGSWWQGGDIEGCHTAMALLSVLDACPSERKQFWEQYQTPLLAADQSASAPNPGELIISEVNWAGSFRDNTNLNSDEWIELMNLSPEALSLQGIHILGAKVGGGALQIDQPLTVGPYGTIVLARLAPDMSQVLKPAAFVFPAMSLSNTQAQLILMSADGTELDRTPQGSWQVGKNQTTPTPLRSSAQRKMFQINGGSDWSAWKDCASPEEEWCQTLASRAFKTGTRNTLATPGQYPPW